MKHTTRQTLHYCQPLLLQRSERKRRNPVLLVRIELYEPRFHEIQVCFVGEINSILVLPLRFLCSLDHLIRSRQYIRRDRQADLLSRFEIDNEIEFCWLLYR